MPTLTDKKTGKKTRIYKCGKCRENYTDITKLKNILHLVGEEEIYLELCNKCYKELEKLIKLTLGKQN